MNIVKKENPFIIFNQWFDQACKHKDVDQPNAMNIATVSKDGYPSNRMVLLKEFNKNGFVFYTNLFSKKGRAIQENPNVSLCFYWEKLNKQIRIEGKSFAVSDKEADKYFDSRPLKSRLGAWVSKQSQPMEGNIDLVKNALNYGIKIGIKKITRPPFWSGFRVKPKNIEFWQDGNSRLHDRALFCRKDYESENWKKTKLYP
jgi:pyridoxamine 5'-phosphate oxidase